MERYEVLRDLGSGNFGVAKLVRDVLTNELFAVKFLERGHKVSLILLAKPQIADVWSCGVTLYVMLVGAYPFGDPSDPKNFRKTIVRITIPEIKKHPWFMKNLPIELADEHQKGMQNVDMNNRSQSIEEIFAIIQEARMPAVVSPVLGGLFVGGGSLELDDMDEDMDDFETSGDFVCAI
ncbi:hypothetical protein B296_00026805 [Ensete ventricosum]|uniref:Protein kinase domain-containing protein n=1 Tax=Ensete ventricosum TaxID=4639 RepID=A0A426Z448_ENSVE|nr:hypothetical protein B296_00026805 [Ensete ventricosum]